MDFKSPQTMSAARTTMPNSSFAKEKSQNSRDPPVTPKQNSINAMQLSLMQARRTPIRSVNTTRIPNQDLIKRDKLPVKRCFSQEVLEQSRHQVFITKNSKVDISMRPSKRMKMGNFTYISTSSHTHTRNHVVSKCNCNATDPNKRKSGQKRLKPPPRNLPPLENIPNKNTARHSTDGVRIQATSPMIVANGKDKDGPKISNFLVSIENFPRGEWRENNFDTEMLREIIFLSNCNMMPVKLIRRNGQINVELICPNDATFFTQISPSRTNGNMLFDILKSPVTLSLKLLSGVIRWILTGKVK